MMRRRFGAFGRPAITDYPGDGPAVIEPANLHVSSPRIPERCVLCFFHDLVERLAVEGWLRKHHELIGEGPPIPVYVLDREPSVAVVWPGLTAPFAACTLEELIAMGGRTFLCCGGAGALDEAIPPGHFVIPTAALRQEGTSYHYQRSGRYSHPHPEAVQALREACADAKVPVLEGITWTTDGVCRETRGLVTRRRREGCLTVEMEAAALFAVARFRKVRLAQLLYAGDNVGGETWDERGWRTLLDVRRALFEISVQAARKLTTP